jgi:hypothetical protein
VLNGSFPRVGDKQQLTNVTRNGKTFNVLNHDSSLPFLNDSVGSGGTSARLHQTMVHHNNNHHHHHGAAAVTARSLRREKTREGSLKSSSKETDSTNNHHSFHHNTSANSIISNSHPFSRSKSFFTNSIDNKPPNIPMKPSGLVVFCI